jgi:hypothetical protein
MDRKDFFNDLEFQNQYIIDQKFQPEGFFEDVPFVLDRHEQFAPYRGSISDYIPAGNICCRCSQLALDL